MTRYRFTLSVPTPIHTHNQLLNITDALRRAGCTDASIQGHADGFELVFNRSAESWQAATSSAIAQVKRAGFNVTGVETERMVLTENRIPA